MLQQKPLMIHFEDTQLNRQPAGMIAWGGTRISLQELQGQDLATRLGATGIWLDTLLEKIQAHNPSALVLMDPDMGRFLGSADANWQRLRSWLARRGIGLTVLRTRLNRERTARSAA